MLLYIHTYHKCSDNGATDNGAKGTRKPEIYVHMYIYTHTQIHALLYIHTNYKNVDVLL